MDKSDKIPVLGSRWSAPPRTKKTAWGSRLLPSQHVESRAHPDLPFSPMGTHSPVSESFTDTVFLILQVMIEDGHHVNPIMGYSWVI